MKLERIGAVTVIIKQAVDCWNVFFTPAIIYLDVQTKRYTKEYFYLCRHDNLSGIIKNSY